MPPKHSEQLVKVSFTITKKHHDIILEEALVRRYDSVSHLAREIFQAWIEEFHSPKSSKSSTVSEK